MMTIRFDATQTLAGYARAIGALRYVILTSVLV